MHMNIESNTNTQNYFAACLPCGHLYFRKSQALQTHTYGWCTIKTYRKTVVVDYRVCVCLIVFVCVCSPISPFIFLGVSGFLCQLVAVGRMVNLSYWRKPIVWPARQPLLPSSLCQHLHPLFSPHHTTLLVLYFFHSLLGLKDRQGQ